MRDDVFQYAKSLKAWVLLAGLLVSSVSASAAPPFGIHRTEDGATVRSALPVSRVTGGPFDDAPGVLSDGLSHYYVATVSDGGPLGISVHKNLHLDTVRIGFDDEDPQSAPVDAALSTVAVAPDTVPADGVSTVVATIVPRDANGVPLGKGLAVWLDGAALWPAFVVGTFVDNGDGSYTVRLASSIAATSELWIRVEGIALDHEPLLTFEDTGEWDLREQAVMRLEDLVTPSGLFDGLIDSLEANPHEAQHVETSLDKTERALDALYVWDDVIAVGEELEKAVDELEKVLDHLGAQAPVAVRTLIDHLVDAARLLAVHHIAEAEASCGVCGQGGPQAICEARDWLQEGDDERAIADPHFKKVVDRYGKAVETALPACN